MTEAKPNRQLELEALLAERKKFEAWLSQLEARRTASAAHVFDRVHADYSTRLDEVRTRLAAEADAIVALVADLEKRLATEHDKVTQKTDERAEAELRSLVGEYSDKEWGAARGKLDAAIADRRAKFDATERELAELKELLGNVNGAPAPSRPSVMQEAAESVDGDLMDATRADEAVAGDDRAADEPAAEVVEVAGEVTVEIAEVEVATDVGQASSDAGDLALAADDASSLTAADVGAIDSAGSDQPAPGFDELAFLRSVAGTPSSPRGTASVSEKSPRPVGKPAERSRRPIEEPPSKPRVSSAATVAPVEEEPASPLGAPTPRTSQAIRSLKCQECGTLNFPTEWYCERCGGELAAF